MEQNVSQENYLETILLLSERLDKVRSIDVANELSFSKPSVSVAVKKLKDGGFVDVDDKGVISLTQAGAAWASEVYDRHVTVTKFFVSLGVSEQTAKKDACEIEHILSQETFEKLKEFLSK
jgi:Mn-dependent DtxR family transcriptional regulator